jgi:hypothetical protein
VTAVEILARKGRVSGSNSLVMVDGADDLLELRLCTLLEAKFRFSIRNGKKEDKVTFTISLPCTTDLVKKQQAEAITEYLMEKGVLLR